MMELMGNKLNTWMTMQNTLKLKTFHIDGGQIQEAMSYMVLIQQDGVSNLMDKR